jgi:hypothetical protein
MMHLELMTNDLKEAFSDNVSIRALNVVFAISNSLVPLNQAGTSPHRMS